METTSQSVEAFSPLVVAGLIGYAWQWARGPKKIPNWLGYVAAGLLTLGAWIFVTRDAFTVVQHDWRTAVAGVVTMYLTARGTASTAASTKTAPKTDSL